ncbi:MAG: hypothetical protein ABIS67_01355 [Candidatus Eisenbacteria bacterium]
MESLARHLRQAALLALVALPALRGQSDANEVRASVAAQGLRIIGAEEVLRDYCTRGSDGSLWLKLPGGTSFELVTSTADASIVNPGDGTFHPFDAAEVRAAIDQVRFPLHGLNADILLLPFPRRGALDSGAGPGLILLAPGVAPISAEQQHAEFTHELGHVAQYQWMPDGDSRWSDYRRKRGIEDAAMFSASAQHANRPHEIFAEDFRALFGGSLATYSGSIENPMLAHPANVPGLDAFLRSLPQGALPDTRLIAGANPARGPVTFAIAGFPGSSLELFDVSGRRIAALDPVAAGAQTVWRWDGRDSGGRVIPRGVVLARVRGAVAAATRISWLP